MDIEIYGFQYLDETTSRDATDWSVYPSSDVYQTMMREETQRMIIRLGDSDIVQVSCGLGSPLEYMSRGRMYCPQWILDILGIQGCGELIQCESVRCEDLPKATRLVLRPSEEMIADARDLLEGPLSLLGAVRSGSVLPLPGGFGTLTVEACEPADEVFLDGAEVAVEFLEDHLPGFRAATDAAVNHSGTGPTVSSPIGAAVAAAGRETEAEESKEDFGFASMIPSSSTVASGGASGLGGRRAGRGGAGGGGGGFVPFSGTGYSLRG